MLEKENVDSSGQLNSIVLADQFQPIAGIADTPESMHRFITNFTGSGRDAVAFLTQALAQPGLRIDEIGDKVFTCKYYVAHVAEFIGDNGEISPMPRMVLISPDGQTLRFVSEGGIRSMDLIRSLLGDGPWEPPLPLLVVPVRTRRGFKTYRIILGN